MKDVITPPQHLYPYRWSLEDAVFTKDKGKVFSCLHVAVALLWVTK